jgi:heterodisulfide reductase subunit C
MNSFLKEVNEKVNGVPLQRCYHCRKCTAGCPMANVMEYNPNRIIKMIQNGLKDEVMNSSTIWLCASCETCISRCPNDVDIARMMDALREMSIEQGYAPKEKNIYRLHDSFLDNIWLNGRINEGLFMVEYKLRSGDLFSDMAMGLGMFLKGKIHPVSPRTKDLAAVRKIFRETK